MSNSEVKYQVEPTEAASHKLMLLRKAVLLQAEYNQVLFLLADALDGNFAERKSLGAAHIALMQSHITALAGTYGQLTDIGPDALAPLVEEWESTFQIGQPAPAQEEPTHWCSCVSGHEI